MHVSAAAARRRPTTLRMALRTREATAKVSNLSSLDMRHDCTPTPLPSCLQPTSCRHRLQERFDVLAPGAHAAYGEFTATTGLTLPDRRARPQPSATPFHTSALWSSSPHAHNAQGEEGGPVIVVHGADGGRIACAKLECEKKGYDWW